LRLWRRLHRRRIAAGRSRQHDEQACTQRPEVHGGYYGIIGMPRPCCLTAFTPGPFSSNDGSEETLQVSARLAYA
jgi:hypothetical protein